MMMMQDAKIGMVVAFKPENPNYQHVTKVGTIFNIDDAGVWVAVGCADGNWQDEPAGGWQAYTTVPVEKLSEVTGTRR